MYLFIFWWENLWECQLQFRTGFKQVVRIRWAVILYRLNKVFLTVQRFSRFTGALSFGYE